MKNSFILWIAAIVITFLTGFLYNVTDKHRPISASLFVDDAKVTYKFDKIFVNGNYKIIVHKDTTSNITGYVLWRKDDDKGYKTITMINSDKILSAELPAIKPVSEVTYKVLLNYKGKEYQLPPYMTVDMQVIGKVPGSIMGLFYFSLFGGILLSVRSGLEYFNNNLKTKKIFLFSTALFFLYFIAVDPLMNTYEMGALNKAIPGVSQIFSLHPLLLFATSIIAMIFLFSMKKKYPVNIISAVVIILIYLFIRI